MTIWINNIGFNSVTELSAKRELRRTDIRYNTQGDMLIDLVNRKYRLTVRFGLVTSKELEQLRSLTKEIFVTVNFRRACPDCYDGKRRDDVRRRGARHASEVR